MSLDLLKEFGDLNLNPGCVDASQSSANKTSVDEDDFGDFEEPEIVTHTQGSLLPPDTAGHSVSSEISGNQTPSTDAGYVQPYSHSFMTDVQDAPSNDDDWGDFSQQSVIFDADEEVTRQEKEAARKLAERRRPEKSINTQLHSTPVAAAYTPTSLISATTRVNSSHGSLNSLKARFPSSKDASERRVEAPKAIDLEKATTDNEPWVDFQAPEAAKPSSVPSLRTLKVAEASNLGPPPSNLPPPSILFPLITTIFGSLATDLRNVQSGQPSDQPSTLSQLRALLSTVQAAAHILAGRKLRWKRDKLLSQSMKIGPAHSGKAGGMKLAGVDKAESRREDQEAAEALQVWKQQAGPLKSMIAALNGQLPERERFKIPEIAEIMPIRLGKPSEGMVTAPKCCFLCGIKRDERVAKVDVDVEDSFGEWWVEHWGHVDCVGFWENNKDNLRQR